jgi:tetratricopeptide (TPR) repeat protein
MRSDAEGDPEPRIAACSSIIDAKSDDKIGLKTTFYNRGGAYFTKGDVAGALADYSQAIDLDRNYTDALVDRAVAYIIERDQPGCVDHSSSSNDRAILDLAKVIELNPKNQEAYLLRANAHQYQKNYNGSLADCNEAIMIDPANPEAYKQRASIYRAMRDHDREAADTQQILRLETQRSK